MRATPALLALPIAAVLLLALVPAHASESREEGGSLPERDPRLREFRGASILHVAGACDPEMGCRGGGSVEPGAFFLEGAGSNGRLAVTWLAVNETLRELRVRVSGYEATGGSPLSIAIDGLPPGRHEVHVAPAHRIAGAYDQRVDWTAMLEVAPALPWVTESGRSAYATTAGCLLDTCDPTTRFEADHFTLPWETRGATLEATWEGPASYRLRIAGTAHETVGTSPLRLDLLDLPAGDHTVELLPDTFALPLEEGSARWTIWAQRAG